MKLIKYVIILSVLVDSVGTKEKTRKVTTGVQQVKGEEQGQALHSTV